MRGKLVRRVQTEGSRRIIPARAGQTTRCIIVSILPTDHPRACGANILPIWGYEGERGSSPRVRGKLGVFGIVHESPRIIPARAGQTAARLTPRRFHPDHPRACGANKAFSRLAMSAFGSSPRVRGKQGTVDLTIPENRIIPARAGQTGMCGRWVPVRSDHPRACGANPAALRALGAHVGSSPRVRGKPVRW